MNIVHKDWNLITKSGGILCSASLLHRDCWVPHCHRELIVRANIIDFMNGAKFSEASPKFPFNSEPVVLYGDQLHNSQRCRSDDLGV